LNRGGALRAAGLCGLVAFVTFNVGWIITSSLYVYPHGSHDWPGRQGALGIRRAAAFLRAHLA
jgi:hypothetical protein